MQVGDAIRSARLARGLSQDRLADALGVARNTIGAWERGENKPQFEMIERLLKVLAPEFQVYFDLSQQTADGHVNISEPEVVYSAGTLRTAEAVMLRRFHAIPLDWGNTSSETYVCDESVSRSIAQKGDVILDVTDDTMDPDFPVGSAVIIDPAVKRPYAGDVVAIAIGDARELRKVERRGRETWAVPINRSYGSRGVRIDGRDDVRVLGAVVGIQGKYGRRRR